MKKLWVVAALCVAAASSCWGDMREPPKISHPLTVKEGGPYQEIDAVTSFRAVQAAAANNRERLSAVEGRVKNLETPHSEVKVESNVGASAPSQKGGVQQMDPMAQLIFGLIGAGIVTCLIIHLVQQGQQAGNGQVAQRLQAANNAQGLFGGDPTVTFLNVTEGPGGYSCTMRRAPGAAQVVQDRGGGEAVDQTARQEVNRAHARIDQVNARVDRAREGLQALRTALQGHTH